MTGQEERKHSMLSPSGAHRWLNCTPSAMLERPFPEETSESAAEGTLAHELAELKLRHYFQTVDFPRTKYTRAVNKLKKETLWQNEMDGYTEEYLDYIKSAALGMKSQPYVSIEVKLMLGAYIPHPDGEDETSGYADCILIGDGLLHVIDFKYGKSPEGRVTAEDNPQLKLYALGAYERYKLIYHIERVKLSIVQPRLPDGISAWETDISELLAWGDYVKERAALAIKGEGDYAPSAKTCRYCRAKGQCRARAEENAKLAFMIDKKPPLISNEEVGEYLRRGEDIAKWLEDLKGFALKECLAGKEVPGWKAVEGKSSREWSDMDKAFEKLQEKGIPEAILWEKKPLTLAQVEKAIGKTDFAAYVGDLVVKKPGNPTLVKESDKRAAITNKITAAEAFKEETA